MPGRSTGSISFLCHLLSDGWTFPDMSGAIEFARVIKGVRTGANQLHILLLSYPDTIRVGPARDLSERSRPSFGCQAAACRTSARAHKKMGPEDFDGVDVFIANSRISQKRIRNCYGRDSSVIYPPGRYRLVQHGRPKRGLISYGLTLCALQKGEYHNRGLRAMPDKRLVVIGHGPDFDSLKATASPNTQLLGFRNRICQGVYAEGQGLYFRCLTRISALCRLKPRHAVPPDIAYGKGGAIETVIEGKTGIFFRSRPLKVLSQAVREFEGTRNFDPAEIRRTPSGSVYRDSERNTFSSSRPPQIKRVKVTRPSGHGVSLRPERHSSLFRVKDSRRICRRSCCCADA